MKVLWLYWTLTDERRVSGLESGTFTPLCWKNNERYTLLPLQPDGIQTAPSDVVHSPPSHPALKPASAVELECQHLWSFNESRLALPLRMFEYKMSFCCFTV